MPGDPPAAPLSRIEFWAMYLPLLLLVLVLMDSLARLVFPSSNGWKYVHMGMSVLWLLVALILVIWIWIVIVPDCNKSALNICSDDRYCCKNQVIAPAVDPAPGCPIFLSPCDPDQTGVTLDWSSGFKWLFALLWVDVLLALVHIVLSWWVGSTVSKWIVDDNSKGIYSQVTENQVESGLAPTVQANLSNYKGFIPVATPGLGSKVGGKQS